jgi:hypothetical protein
VLAHRERGDAPVAGWDEFFVFNAKFSSHPVPRGRLAPPRP